MSQKKTISRTDQNGRAMRETVESIVVAVILAFLFRAFVAEAFVIPTGSMAPTLQGSHKDVSCPKCGYTYRAGASIENDDDGRGASGFVLATTCPICRYTVQLDPDDPEHDSFTGDRILVSKFAYEIGDPQRWDVIVFKYPGNAKQNYIKRLVGLPNEVVRILHGDIFTRQANEDRFEIERKPPAKVEAMLQVVDDTAHIPADLAEAGWPSRWQPWRPGQRESEPERLAKEDLAGIKLASEGEQPTWLRYRHYLPDDADWARVENDAPLGRERFDQQLITDYYAYNDYTYVNQLNYGRARGHRDASSLGLHWVGDLAGEFELQIANNQGKLLLDLIEGGAHFVCEIDVATGEAVLKPRGDQIQFLGEDSSSQRRGKTPLRGPGQYKLQYANVDDQLLLWVNGKLIPFEGSTAFARSEHIRPVWDPDDPGDLAPVGIGAQGGLAVTVQRARVLRDVYYIATSTHQSYSELTTDYEGFEDAGGGRRQYQIEDIRRILSSPEEWDSTQLFESRRYVEFTLGEDEFFPLGDNSPQSKDARLWGRPESVERKLLTGKALLIYWPHMLPKPIPLPNVPRMGLIR